MTNNLELEPAQSTGVGVRFEYADDRFSHTVFYRDNGEEIPILQSREGDAADHWPPSPPLQSLVTEQRDSSGKVILALGQAGDGHWSLSVEQQNGALVFDVACRYSATLGWLGNSYRIVPNGSEIWKTVAVHAESMNGDEAAVVHRDATVLTIEANSSLSQTTRWRYRIGA